MDSAATFLADVLKSLPPPTPPPAPFAGERSFMSGSKPSALTAGDFFSLLSCPKRMPSAVSRVPPDGADRMSVYMSTRFSASPPPSPSPDSRSFFASMSVERLTRAAEVHDARPTCAPRRRAGRSSPARTPSRP